MKYVLTILALAASVLVLTGCGGGEKVSWATQEMQRDIAKKNSSFNARKFIAENKHFSGANIMNRGDSTIGAKCAPGDGWSSIDLVDDRGGVIAKLKCSTASASLGCWLEDDFKTRSFNSQEKRCNPELPVPLEPIES